MNILWYLKIQILLKELKPIVFTTKLSKGDRSKEDKDKIFTK